MLRDPALVPLSHQHQHALALCVRIQRAPRSTAAEINDWQKEIVRLWEQEICFHFDAEERVLFPAAEQFVELRGITEDLRSDHIRLRGMVEKAAQGVMTGEALRAFASRLSEHIRREERGLFEGMQRQMSSEDLSHLGECIEHDFRASGLPARVCEIKPSAKP